MASLREFVLFDRSKWADNRALRFNWKVLYNRKTPISTFQMVAMLLSRESLYVWGAASHSRPSRRTLPLSCPRSFWRTDYERRQALIELDVLCAQALDITLEDLCTLYRAQFPILHSYERDTWYDQKGRIIFSPARRGRPATQETIRRPAYGILGGETDTALGWESVREMKEGVVTYTFVDDTQPGGPVERTIHYHAPFDRCDREEDYAEAWAFFKQMGSLS